MGLTKAIENIGRVQKGQTALSSADQVLGVDELAITPDNPGDFTIHRSVPVLTKVRSFTHQEADALDAMAKKTAIEAEATKKAMQAMKQVKTADTTIQTAFNSYRRHEAKKTLEQVESNARTAKAINALRGGYGLAYQSVQGAIATEDAKQQAIFGTSEQTEKFKSFW